MCPTAAGSPDLRRSETAENRIKSDTRDQTDRRLLCRCDDGRLLALLWAEVCGLQIALDQQRLLVSYGDEPPILFMGFDSAALTVAAVAGVYGLQSLWTHPELSTVRFT
jgi:hypothetical protein